MSCAPRKRSHRYHSRLFRPAFFLNPLQNGRRVRPRPGRGAVGFGFRLTRCFHVSAVVLPLPTNQKRRTVFLKKEPPQGDGGASLTQKGGIFFQPLRLPPPRAAKADTQESAPLPSPGAGSDASLSQNRSASAAARALIPPRAALSCFRGAFFAFSPAAPLWPAAARRGCAARAQYRGPSPADPAADTPIQPSPCRG